MPIYEGLRSFERQCLRPLSRRLKRLIGQTRRRDRLALLEQRIDQLESLIRELTGLAYLRLDDQAAAKPPAGGVAEARPREAA
jgi:hypothetical protein